VDIEIDRIQTEAIDPAFQPEARDIQQRILHSGFMKVQVRL
jgi:hypothetical protein